MEYDLLAKRWRELLPSLQEVPESKGIMKIRWNRDVQGVLIQTELQFDGVAHPDLGAKPHRVIHQKAMPPHSVRYESGFEGLIV
jgi:hypothetical protein